MKKSFILAVVLIGIFYSCSKESTNEPDLLSSQGEQYKEVKIGNQIWMKKNLDVSCYQNGDTIPEVTDPSEFHSLTTGAWCYYNNNQMIGEIFGKLYNWYAVNDPRGLAPFGWHVPSESDWNELISYLGGYKEAGGKLKSTGNREDVTGLWEPPNSGATNQSQFSAIPGGLLNSAGSSRLYYAGRYWTSTQTEPGVSSYFIFSSSTNSVMRNLERQSYGFSVRCIKNKYN
ncbi:MAG TPA: fibrobacter succinogenes major paralogous domain-containing protein [Candidatus Kapabacteria bacterium]|nr:fibrobacter succinogenes major paralogous domain-containing protein [Candidatus Kapabacteria bacterium]HPO63340.1 fibrobacter succinogenes major paralogous domain-containing protein [Candidatus Kapabacteria bacterium]